MCRFADALPLRAFMHRQRVLKQYRSLLRAATALRQVDASSARDARQQVVVSFRKWAGEGDKQHVQTLLREGDSQLEMIKGMLAAANVEVPDYSRQAVRSAGAATPQAAVPAEDGLSGGWYGQGPEDDIHGRVGEEWPWNRS